MNTISMCRPAPRLPESITQDLLFVQMHTLERHLAATNPLFEEDLYMGLLEALSGIYSQVNRAPVRHRVIVESTIRPPIELKEHERKMGRPKII